MLRAGLEPATYRLGVDNGNVAGPQQNMWHHGKPARIRTRTCEVGARRASVTPRVCRTRPAGIDGAPLCPLSYERRSLRQESNPHLGLTTGACLPLTLRRLEW